MPLWLGDKYITSFSHLHDFEPAPKNHAVPHYGIFSSLYYFRILNSIQGQADKFASFKKNVGPPNYRWNPRLMPLKHNDYLAS